MNLLRKTTCCSFKGKFLIYLFFIVIHIALFNVNMAEWGDSYRILRASQFIKRLDYPKDEKRPPLFSAILATNPSKVDPVFWGRVVMFVFSLASFFVFDKLVSQYIKKEKYQKISLILFTINPVYLYWSLRIMADVPLAFFTILIFYLLSRWKNNLDTKRSVLLGLILGLTVLTRFEGYLVMFSAFFGVLFLEKGLKWNDFLPKNLWNIIKNKLPKIFIIGLTTLLTILPYLLYRNPLKSSYFGEQEFRSYYLGVFWIYFTSLFYILGFIPFFYFIFKSIFSHKRTSTVVKFLQENVGVSVFLLLECVLILWWPAAVPRLFLSLIPFFIIVLVISYEEFSADSLKIKFVDIAALMFLLIFYGVSQYFLKLQFLVSVRYPIIVVFILQALVVTFILLKKEKLMMTVAFLSMLFWSVTIIWQHRFLYVTMKEASIYVYSHLSGKILYNDPNSVADWYINQINPRKDLIGEFYPVLSIDDINFKRLNKKGADYIILTNEPNPIIKFNTDKRPYLIPIKSFKYNVFGTKFSSEIFKLNKDYIKQ